MMKAQHKAKAVTAFNSYDRNIIVTWDAKAPTRPVVLRTIQLYSEPLGGSSVSVGRQRARQAVFMGATVPGTGYTGGRTKTTTSETKQTETQTQCKENLKRGKHHINLIMLIAREVEETSYTQNTQTTHVTPYSW